MCFGRNDAHFSFEHLQELRHLLPDVPEAHERDALAGKFHHGFVPVAEVGGGGPSALLRLRGIVAHAVAVFQQ